MPGPKIAVEELEERVAEKEDEKGGLDGGRVHQGCGER